MKCPLNLLYLISSLTSEVVHGSNHLGNNMRYESTHGDVCTFDEDIFAYLGENEDSSSPEFQIQVGFWVENMFWNMLGTG